MPHFIGFLTVESNEVLSCAALCIEKLRVLKDEKQLCYTTVDGTQFLVKVFTNLFSALKLLESQENHSASRGLSWGFIHCGCQALCITMFGWANNYFCRILQKSFQSCFSLSSSVYWNRIWQTPYCFQILIGLIESKRVSFPPNKMAFFPPSLMSTLWNCQVNVPSRTCTEAFAGDITYLDMSSLCNVNLELHLHKQPLSQAWISTDYEFI